MSQTPNEKPQQQIKKETKKQKPVNENEKANTDAWKQKMAKKKLQKQAKDNQATQGEPETKQDKKDKKKKDKPIKDKPKEEEKAQEPKQKEKKPIATTLKAPQVIQPQFKKLETIETLIIPKYPQLQSNRSTQVDLIQKQVLNLIRAKDTILHLGKLKLQSNPNLFPGSGKNNFKIVDIPGYASHKNSQVVCRYEDISYLISEEINKIFIESEVIFKNGSALVRKGYENIILIANHYNKPVIIVSGSWNYSRVLISSYDQLQNLYGQDLVNKYDWINSDAISFVCIESGSVLPTQISYQVEQAYKNYGINGAKW